jgi:O-antigen ligase
MISRLIENRWFALVELIWVSAAGITWALVPELGWRILPVAILPWLPRLAGRQFPFKRTSFDFLLLVFFLTAVVGVWAAYDQEAALAKFWLLVAGILLFYALARQPQNNLWLVAGLISAFGAGVAVFFLLTHDWQATPARIGLIQQAAVWWMGIRPELLSGFIHQNTAGGMMALSMPFVFALGGLAWQEKRWLLNIWVVVAGLLLVVGVLLTTSWGTWIALSAAFGLWLLWILSRKLAKSMNRSAALIFGTAVILVAILAVVVITVTPGGALTLTERLLGPTNGATRLELAQAASYLVGDFPFTGGGLSSFPGLYSHYILGIPFYYFGYSHSLFFDIVLEQGVIGLLTFALIYLGSFWVLFRNLQPFSRSSLILASLASLAIILVHGLVDNVIYYKWGALLVLMIPGFAVGITRPAGRQSQGGEQPQPGTETRTNRRGWRILGIVAAVAVAATILFVGYTYRQTWMAAWHANLGAVEMARVELAGFPGTGWDDGSEAALLAPAEGYFLQALAYNPSNRTANHRLGLIAMQRWDFATAVSYLETAHRIDDDHRGITKALGYSHVWSDEFDRAAPLLNQIPEAGQELSTYVWWWETQGRGDLAENANSMLAYLDSQSY